MDRRDIPEKMFFRIGDALSLIGIELRVFAIGKGVPNAPAALGERPVHGSVQRPEGAGSCG
jgi:hypothetical protein